MSPQKKTGRSRPIVRVRTGCFTCRGRKKKCDEKRPKCAGCVRNDLICRWPTVPASATTEIEEPTQDKTSGLEPLHARTGDDDQPIIVDNEDHDSLTVSNSQTPPFAVENDEALADVDMGCPDEASIVRYRRATVSDSWSEGGRSLPRGMSMLPDHGNESYELLNHYLARTALSMGNGSTDANPFVVQLIPLAFSSDLILHLILTQSAAHRATDTDSQVDGIAHGYYGRSLQLFRQTVGEYLGGEDAKRLTLAMGALIMCFTETAKGDIDGAVFDHLSAANSLLVDLICQQTIPVPSTLKPFLIEYYVYTATVSMISTDARFNVRPSLSPLVEEMAQELISSNYVGHLCGCWLELLILIPRIFDLGKRAFSQRDEETDELDFPSADDIALFSSLHARILSYCPLPGISPQVSIVGRIFQQAVLLYLFTTLNGLSSAVNGSHDSIIQATVSSALHYLEQIPATARINTSLCWPLAVIASCIDDAGTQDSLRARLKTMSASLGLGNIKQTLNILEHMWQLHPSERSPWAICSIMQEHQLWISFA